MYRLTIPLLAIGLALVLLGAIQFGWVVLILGCTLGMAELVDKS